jgi:hypothetical protein
MGIVAGISGRERFALCWRDVNTRINSSTSVHIHIRNCMCLRRNHHEYIRKSQKKKKKKSFHCSRRELDDTYCGLSLTDEPQALQVLLDDHRMLARSHGLSGLRAPEGDAAVAEVEYDT